MNKKYSVIISPLAQKQIIELLEYLKTNWNQKVKSNFIQKFDKKINQIANNPKSAPKSQQFNGIYLAVIQKQISFVYRITNRKIEIIALIDNRSNPDKLERILRNY